MATFRLGPAERWLSCYVGDPLGPLLESYSMVRSLSERWGDGLEIGTRGSA